MSMTLQEAAIKSCEDRIKHLESTPIHHYGKRQRERAIELERIKIAALRPITREQAKETKAVFFQPGVEDVAQDSYRCSHCYVQEFGDTRGINFCPHCGAPMTDEAVEILAKRMEEIRNV